MKPIFIKYLLPLLFIGVVAFVVLRYYNGKRNEYVAFYPLQERKGASATLPEWAAVKNRANYLIRVVRDNPADTKSQLALATMYIQEARVTGNGDYYNKAALKYLDGVLQREPQNFEALTLKALIDLSLHHFSDALVIAEQAQAIGPYNAFVYGLLVDGNVELGNYKAAIDAADRMVSLRPDIRSYSRIGYLREIHGDLDGAIDAMQRAVKAGGAGNEPACWARVQLGKLYEQAGDLKSAAMHYTIALDQRPQYAYALAGMARIYWAKEEYAKAVPLYLQADTLVNDPAFKEELAQMYLDMGKKKKADSLLLTIAAEIAAVIEKGKDDAATAHHAEDQLAFVHQLLGNYDTALQHALTEYNRRPQNIDMNAMVAWVYHLKGLDDKALPYVAAALKTGCKKPELLVHMGLVFAGAGQRTKGKAMLQQALEKGLIMPHLLRKEAMNVLATL